MAVRGDERGQSIQIGAILLFGVLVISFATYQAVLVPQQNAAVEAEHAEVVDRQTQELRNDIVSVPGSASDRAVTLSLGTTYPSRVIAVNPSPPSGAVRTVGTGDESINLTLANAVATDGETRDFWDGTDQSRNTGAVVYEPNYNEFRNPGTAVYENTLLYAEFRDGEASRTDQRLVDGDRLTLVALNGSLDRGGSDSTSLDVQAVSASDRSVTVRNETGANVTVRVASRRSADVWRDLLEDDDQFVGQGGHVVSVTERPLPDPDFDLVAIELEQGVTYTVRMAKVGLGTQVTGEDEMYLTDVQGEGASVQEESTTSLVVEVRDAYNNPVTGVAVEASVGSGAVSPQSTATDGDGQAVFKYEADEIDGVTSRTVPVNASIAVDPGSSFDPSTPENVTVNVTVQNTDGSGVEADSSADGTGAGQAGDTDHATSSQQNVTAEGGLWYNITGVSGISLRSPRFVPTESDTGGQKQDIRYFRLAFTIVEDVEDGNDHKYHILLGDSGGFGYTLSGGSWSNNAVYLYEQFDNGTTKTRVDGTAFDTTELSDWESGSDPLELLDSGEYQGDISSELNRVRSDLDDENPDEIVFTLVRGRTNMTAE
jgi:hypothetical protein